MLEEIHEQPETAALSVARHLPEHAPGSAPHAGSLVALPLDEGLTERFERRRVLLPDHHAEWLPEPAELQSTLAALRELGASGPVFVHCVAAMERSPLECQA